MTLSQKERTAAIQKSLETRERFPISYFDSRRYIQHNLNLADGLGPLLAFMDSLPIENTRVNVRRMFEDGEYSVAHADYLLGDWGSLVGFEVHRWEEDRIVEHWDNLQPTPASLNESGRSMTDGTDFVSSDDYSSENKTVIAHFTDQVLIHGQMLRPNAFFEGGHLVQHSPHYGDGVPAFEAQLAKWRINGRTYAHMHKILSEGDLVLTMCEGGIGEQQTAFYDLYRLSAGKIAEHWEVNEPIPPRGDWKNSNGKF